MKEEIMNSIDEIMLKTEHLEAFSDLLESAVADKLENKGFNNIIKILRAIANASKKEVKEIDETLDKLYCNLSKYDESEKIENTQ